MLIAAAALITVTGDPGAGAPHLRIALPSTGSLLRPLSDPAAASDGAATGLAADRKPLPAAPLPGLAQMTPAGPLPVIGPGGRTPAEAYARPFQDTGAPEAALVIRGLGLNAAATRAAIEQLPPAVTLAFSPYAEGLQGWIDLARANGHEVLLEAPMEPSDYPQEDPGPNTLLSGDPPAQTVQRLQWVMTRASGYFGLTNHLGARFLASQSAMGALSAELKRRGLDFIDDGAASGRALAVGAAYPLTIQKVRAWAADLSKRGIVLAPASAMTARS